jgi:hypothetical protein
MSDINAVRNNPTYKQAVTDLLIIDDVAGYIDKSGKYIAGYEPASFSPKIVKSLIPTFRGLGVSSQTEAVLTKPNADLQAIKNNLLAKLSTAEKNTYFAKRKLLKNPAKKEDLRGIIRSLPYSRNKQAVTDLLIIDDVAGYINRRNKYKAGYEPASFSPKIVKSLIPTFRGFKLNNNAKQVYFKLRKGLDKPESQADLLIQLCKIDSNESYCPKPGDNLATLRFFRDTLGLYIRGPQDITGQGGAGMFGHQGVGTSPALQDIAPSNFAIELGVNPQLIGPNGFKKYDQVIWRAKAGITAKELIHSGDNESGRDTYRFGVDLGTALHLNFTRYFQPFASVGYQFKLQQSQNPNVFYPDASDHQLGVKGGALLDVSKYFAFSLFGTHQYNWLDHSFNNVIKKGYEMDGGEQLNTFGGGLQFKLNQLSKWAPDIKINLEGGIGSTNVPEALAVGDRDNPPIISSKAVAGLTTFKGSLNLLWNNKLSVLGGFRSRDIESWSPELRSWFGGGYKWDSGWHLRGTVNILNNLDPANPVDGGYVNLLLTEGWGKFVTLGIMAGSPGVAASVGFNIYGLWETLASKK